MLSCTSKRSHRHTILHVSFSNSFGLASARPTPQGLSGAPILNPSEEDKNLRDRRNFPKKMLKLGYIRETGKKLTGNPYRSPKLYTFDEEAYAAAKKIGMRLEF